MSETNKNPGRKELRSFGIVVGTVAVGLFGLLLPFFFDHAFPTWPWIVAAPLWLLGLAYPAALRPVHTVWMKIGAVLGWINTRIILGIIFFVIFTPISLFLKIFRIDPMRRALNSESDSYRVTSDSRSPEHMEKPY